MDTTDTPKKAAPAIAPAVEKLAIEAIRLDCLKAALIGPSMNLTPAEIVARASVFEEFVVRGRQPEKVDPTLHDRLTRAIDGALDAV